MNATFKTVLLWLSLVIVIFLAYHFAQIQKKEARADAMNRSAVVAVIGP